MLIAKSTFTLLGKQIFNVVNFTTFSVMGKVHTYCKNVVASSTFTTHNLQELLQKFIKVRLKVFYMLTSVVEKDYLIEVQKFKTFVNYALQFTSHPSAVRVDFSQKYMLKLGKPEMRGIKRNPYLTTMSKMNFEPSIFTKVKQTKLCVVEIFN
ncbi:CLUMA_CG014710, isoform A [Clunio marinus]|uniref:CLUMA_CG014710, isoform A n=1 Tax=Clunio marinus TaxID=568069 RepID=A0A1J1INM5_9DIPT|nr:CLUMA_CG014710, isoform A [Clunio marinus]